MGNKSIEECLFFSDFQMKQFVIELLESGSIEEDVLFDALKEIQKIILYSEIWKLHEKGSLKFSIKDKKLSFKFKK